MSSCGIGGAVQNKRRNRISNNMSNNFNGVLGTSNNNSILSQHCNTNIQGLSSDNWCTLLSNFIGRNCECEFVLGDDLVSRTGILNDVGTDFLILTSSNNNNSDVLLCDTCSLRFVRVE